MLSIRLNRSNIISIASCREMAVSKMRLKPQKCDTCEISFLSRFCLQLHRHIHSQNDHSNRDCKAGELKQRQCNVCKKIFKKTNNLKQHKMLHRNKRNKKRTSIKSGTVTHSTNLQPKQAELENCKYLYAQIFLYF